MSFQPEERYWTDYLRIALPVLGLLLLVSLLWWWAGNIIGGPGDEPPPTPNLVAAITPINATPPPPVPTATPEPVVPTPGPPPPTATAAVVLTPAPTSAPAPTIEPAPEAAEEGGDPANPCAGLPAYAVDTTVEPIEDLNLRDAPSTDSNTITTLPAGTELRITGEFVESGQCDWWPVTVVSTGQSGFVFEQFIREAGAS